MKKVDLLVLKAFLGPFIATFFVVEFVFIMQFFYVYIDDFIGKGLPWNIIVELVSYLSANTVPLALPLAILLSAIMTFGNLGERYELIALKTAGISMRRTASGLFVVIVILSIGSLAFSNYIVPTANLKFWTTLLDISRSKPGVNIKENVFYRDIEGYIIKVDHKDPDQRGISGIVIHDCSNFSKPHNIITAEHGEMYTTGDNKYLVLKLFNGTKYETLEPDPQKRGVSRRMRTQFAEMEKVMDLSDFQLTRTKEDDYKNLYQMFNIAQLEDYIDSLKRKREEILGNLERGFTSVFVFLNDSAITIPNVAGDGALIDRLLKHNPRMSTTASEAITKAKTVKSQLDNPIIPQLKSNTDLIRRSRIELHRKYTSALACAVLFLIGAPFGVIVRKGGIGLPVIAATLLYIAFLVLYKLGENMAKNGSVDEMVGMWAPPLLMVPIALYLVFKANNDAAVLQLESYQRLIRFVRNVFQKERE